MHPETSVPNSRRAELKAKLPMLVGVASRQAGFARLAPVTGTV